MLATAGRTKYFEDLEVGQEASMSRIVSEADIVAYAALSGDYNPVHLDSEYAAKTIFKERIAHGILSAGYISAIFGMKLPGPGAIYVSQTLFFKGPVKIDDRVETDRADRRTHSRQEACSVRLHVYGRGQARADRRSSADGSTAAEISATSA